MVIILGSGPADVQREGAREAHCETVGERQHWPLPTGPCWILRAEASPTWTTLPSAEKEVTCTSTACSL